MKSKRTGGKSIQSGNSFKARLMSLGAKMRNIPKKVNWNMVIALALVIIAITLIVAVIIWTPKLAPKRRQRWSCIFTEESQLQANLQYKPVVR